jgi:Tfp pilus tip-associated adhesin PilY1
MSLLHNITLKAAYSPSRIARQCVFALLAAVIAPVFAAPTQLDDRPVNSGIKAYVKPNIMLLMDTSTSMGFTHMPDEVEVFSEDAQRIGYKSYQCNSIYYNPTTKYDPPKRPNGTDFPAASFTAALTNVFGSGTSTTVNLASSFTAFGTSTRAKPVADTPQPAYYYIYTGSAVMNPTTAPCTQVDNGAPGTSGTVSAIGGTWRRVLVSTTSGQGTTVNELENFANWYVYYRTRLSMSKSALSTAFAPLTDKYRIGFITANPTAPIDPLNPQPLPVLDNKFEPIRDFDGTQKQLWYDKMFSQTASGGSPMREGLARVGRYYAGKTDGINQNMIVSGATPSKPDPMPLQCQRNYTLMTTDGYWNNGNESKGPVGLDGLTLVGNQDGVLTGANGNTPRPIFDGGSNASRLWTNKVNNYSLAPCTGPNSISTSTQIIATRAGVMQSTSQTLLQTSQIESRTSTVSAVTTQALRSTTQTNRTTSQLQETKTRLTEIVTQLTASTSQTFRYTTQLTELRRRVDRSTSQTLRSTTQTLQSTAQTIRRLEHIEQTTTQRLQTTVQARESTQQWLETRSQTTNSPTFSTSRVVQSTSRTDQTVIEVRQSQTQLNSYSSATEQYTPVGSCTPVPGSIACVIFTPMTNQPVASCTPSPASAGNSWTATTCATVTISGPAAVASCTPAAANSGNGFQTTQCTPVNTSNVPVASCTASGPNSGNSFTTTTCTPITTGPTVGACPGSTAPTSANLFTTTTCSNNPSTVVTGPTPVQTCTASGPIGGLTITCNNVVTTNVGVPSCSPQTAASNNGWVTRTCNNINSPVGVQTCPANQTANAGNSWTSINCVTNTTGPVAVAAGSCAAQTGNSGNNWLTRTCTTVVDSPNTPVQTCNAGNGSGPNFVNTICTANNTGPTGVQSCVASPANAGNAWTATTCASNNTGPTAVASCTNALANAGNSWTATNCTPNNTGPTPVASCTAQGPNAGNNQTTTTCNVVTISGPTPVSICTPAAANAGNGFVETTCPVVTSNEVAVDVCTPGIVGGGLQVFCRTPTTTNVPVQTCTPQTRGPGNQWLTRTCGNNNSGPTFVAACTPQIASAPNWLTRQCITDIIQPATGVQTCTNSPAIGPNFVTTTCNTSITSAPILPAACTPQSASAANGWITTACPVTATGPTPVQNCTGVNLPSAANAGNNFTASTCSAVPSAPTLVASCTNQTGDSSNNWLTRACTTVNSPWVAAASCSPVPAAAGNGFTATQCRTNNSASTPVASCVPVPANAGNNFTATTCTPNNTGPSAVASCTPAPANAGNNFTATTCTPNPASTTTFVASCTPAPVPNSGNSFLTTACSQNIVTATVATCTGQAANAGNNFTTVSCALVPGQKIQVSTSTGEYTEVLSGANVIATSPMVTSTGSVTDVDGICYPLAGGNPTLPTTQPTPTAGCTAWPCSTTTNVITGGSQNSLADVAQYYYINDLRPDYPNTDLTGGTTTALITGVGGPEADRGLWQHMTTYGMGLGVSGTLQYRSDYLSAPTGAFANLRSGSQNWPVWPDPTPGFYTLPQAYNNPKSIDDFWHASVNGRGQFFGANNPQQVVDGVRNLVTQIDAANAAGNAFGISSAVPTVGDNFAYVTSYKSLEWTGDLQKREIVNSEVSATVTWSAQTMLAASTSASCDNRNIYYNSAGVLTPFTWNTSRCDATGSPTGVISTGLTASEQAFFGSTAVVGLGHYSAMDSAQVTAATGANLVNFLRGQRGLEGFVPNLANKLFRTRAQILADIVGSTPAVVRNPKAEYADAGYGAFATAQASRATTVYVGSNSGMLHAFSGSTGEEKWAYVPRAVMPSMYNLASINYDVNHKFYVDGSPSVGDVYDTRGTPAWKTILVGGLNKGGKGFYALDITDPDSPKALWEFNQSASCGITGATSDCNVGFSFGRPVITKMLNGTWVVLLTSGYNNITGGGTGVGTLYVVNALTGELINKIATTAGDTTTPSGLRDINNYVANGRIDNTTLRVYGGDLLGNMWRFDINDTLPPTGTEATLLAVAKDASGTVQPITTRVQLAEVDGSTFVVAATGQLLSADDFSTAQTQSVYAFKDPLGTASPIYSNLRTSLRPITMTRTGSGSASGGNTSCTGSAASCAISVGWFMDFPDSAERVNIDPVIIGSTLAFVSNIPSAGLISSCSSGGVSYLSALNLITAEGKLIPDGDTNTGSVRISNTLSVGLNILLPPPGNGSSSGEATGTVSGEDGFLRKKRIQIGDSAPVGRRVSWRELIKP